MLESLDVPLAEYCFFIITSCYLLVKRLWSSSKPHKHTFLWRTRNEQYSLHINYRPSVLRHATRRILCCIFTSAASSSVMEEGRSCVPLNSRCKDAGIFPGNLRSSSSRSRPTVQSDRAVTSPRCQATHRGVSAESACGFSVPTLQGYI